jgi:hypothetical protein
MKSLHTMLMVIALMSAGYARAETFEVEHNHFLRSCKGTLIFGDATVDYVTEHKEHARTWKYEEIQQMAIAPNRISILTFNSRKVEFGADQTFDFKVLSGKPNDGFRSEMEKKLARPLVSSILPEQHTARFLIPARHRMTWSSSQGILEFGEAYLVFRSGEKNASRVWRYDELMSMGSTGPFQLRIGVLQKTGGEYGEEKNYKFDLKRRLAPEEYDFIWEKINRRSIAMK